MYFCGNFRFRFELELSSAAAAEFGVTTDEEFSVEFAIVGVAAALAVEEGEDASDGDSDLAVAAITSNGN